MLAYGIIDLSGVATVVSDVVYLLCGVNSVMSAGALDVYGCDSVVSD